ncbi:MAG: DUF1566 domain-containing protein [Deltaproteobacteria bacterium]|nr:DUF1566 domain-containing protein [Deltaproteobacteria bacterium]
MRDNVTTGLEWESSAPRPLIWEDAIEYCDRLHWGGRNDWRLPDEFALQSFVGYDTTAPASANEETSKYWSSSSYVSKDSDSWTLYTNGDMAISSKTDSSRVSCVQSGSSSGYITRFNREVTVENQPVLADNATCLMWQGCAAGQSGGDCLTGSTATMNWAAALAYCENLSWGGFDSWRLPNVIEIRGIANNGGYASPLHEAALPALETTCSAITEVPVICPSWSWSSTTSKDANNHAWHVSFSDGWISYEMGQVTSSFDNGWVPDRESTIKTSKLNVRCVRDRSNISVPTEFDSAHPTDTNSETGEIDTETVSDTGFNCVTTTETDNVEADTDVVDAKWHIKLPRNQPQRLD